MDIATAPEPAADIRPAVLERARRGDQEAFAAVIRHYDPGLRALAYRLLGDRDRMDDALQEAYVKAFRALPRFQRRAKVGTWLYRIVYNTCLDELRKARRTAAEPLDENVDQPGDGRTRPTSPPGGETSRARSPHCPSRSARPCSSSTPRGSTTATRPRYSASRRAPSPRG